MFFFLKRTKKTSFKKNKNKINKFLKMGHIELTSITTALGGSMALSSEADVVQV